MRAAATIDVTYTGNDDPFIDRLYGTRLTFEKGQTRPLSPDLAARFLRHSDVFKGPETEQAPGDAAASTSTSEDATAKSTPAADPNGEQQTTTPQEPATPPQTQEPVDDTAAQLAEAERLAEEQRKKDETRFELHMSIDTMTKAAVRDFVKANFKQELADGKVADMRAQAKSMVDQFGAP